MLKLLVKKYFKNLVYFYSYLRAKIFILIGLTFLVGIMDGLGLSMFLPLFQIAADGENSGSVGTKNVNSDDSLVRIFQSLHIPLVLINMLILMVVFFVIKGVFFYLKGIYDSKVSKYFLITVRRNLLSKFSKLSFLHYMNSDVGRIQNLMTGEVNTMYFSFREYLSALQCGIMVIVYMAFAFIMNAQFACFILIGGLIFNFLFKKIYDLSKKASRRLVKDANSYQGMIIQFVANFKYLKATGFVDNYVKRIDKNIVDVEDSNYKIGKLSAISQAIREPILILIVATVIWLQVYLMGAKLSTIIVSMLFFYRALSNVSNFQSAYNNFISRFGTLENIANFQSEMDSNRERNGNLSFEKLSTNAILENYNFYYGENYILKNLNIELLKNNTIGIVGESGSGKTTIVNILAGLICSNDLNSVFYLNGKNMVEFDKSSYQKRIGYITQEPVIFNDTIYNNITLWSEPTNENIQKFNEVLKRAKLDEFIESLGEKELTLLGNSGVNLSGGQKQRISIARELFKDIDILILDEATSALDSETEKYIQENIDSLKGNFTIIIIAHRLSTIKNADNILLMSKGKIIEQGNFETLRQKSPIFRNMVELQDI